MPATPDDPAKRRLDETAPLTPEGTGPSDEPSALPLPSVSGAPASSGEPAAFTPGTLIAARYRVIALIGRGGMGEVYRAEDLVLGQDVAIKFLPASSDRAWHERMAGEVRLARRVSHPNVCRVYDIGVDAGRTYLTMEHVPGDDLRTLLKRIGRLPQDRAIRIAQQLCAGLAAAHDAGILHRDLKPGNIILDADGHPRILDFGLAAVSGAVAGREIRSGTPGYMAPEQLSGESVDERSDVYALGLVIYELFTGQPAMEAESVSALRELQRGPGPRAPGDVVEGLDPRVDRAVLAALCADPRRRPASARALGAMLPGGDALAAAVAAGETPSPEMVAAAGGSGRLSPRTAACAVLAVLALLVSTLVLNGKHALVSAVPLVMSDDELAFHARSMLDELGLAGPGEDRAADEAWGFDLYEEYLDEIRRSDRSLDRWDRLTQPRPSAVDFWYRRSPAPMAERGLNAPITFSRPGLSVPGMLALRLAPDGKLRELVVQRQRSAGPAAGVEPTDAAIDALLAAAGLERAAMERAEPERVPPVFADSRRAWTGVYPAAPAIAIRVEAAWLAGTPTAFRIIEDRWPAASDAALEQPSDTFRGLEGGGVTLEAVAYGAVSVTCLGLAMVSLRNRRGDRDGAFRLAVVGFVLVLASELLGTHRIVSIGTAADALIGSGAIALVNGVFLWIVYLALEPLVRRQAPETLIAWTRLVNGGWRDPLVGHVVLIGLAGGLLCAALSLVLPMTPTLTGNPPGLPFKGTAITIPALMGERHALSGLLREGVYQSIILATLLLAMLVVIGLVVRRRALAIVLTTALQAAIWVANDPDATATYWIIALVQAGVVVTALVRYGMLAVAAGAFAFTLATGLPVTTDMSSWRFGLSTIAFAAPAALAVYAGVIAAMPSPDGRATLTATAAG